MPGQASDFRLQLRRGATIEGERERERFERYARSAKNKEIFCSLNARSISIVLSLSLFLNPLIRDYRSYKYFFFFVKIKRTKRKIKVRDVADKVPRVEKKGVEEG